MDTVRRTEGGGVSGVDTVRRREGELFNGRGDNKERKVGFSARGRERFFSAGVETARRGEGGLFSGRGDRKGGFSAAGKKRVLIERCSTQTAIEAFVSKSPSALRGFPIRALLFHRLGAPLCGAPSRPQGSAGPASVWHSRCSQRWL